MMMEQPLPYKDYTYVDGAELEWVKWDELDERSDVMYMAYVDLEYPRELHR